MIHIIYSKMTGIITRTVECLENQAEAQLGDNEALISFAASSVRDDTHYVDLEGPRILKKSPLNYLFETTDTGITFTGLPEGGQVKLLGIGVVTTDSEPTEIELDFPGKYMVFLTNFVGYLDEHREITFHG